MSKVIIQSMSTSSSNETEFGDGKTTNENPIVLAPDSDVADDGLSNSDPDVIPPSQDAFDVQTDTEMTTKKDVVRSTDEQQSSILGSFNQRPVFGGSAALFGQSALHSWQSNSINIFESLDGNQKEYKNSMEEEVSCTVGPPASLKQLETVTLESSSSGSFTEAKGPENSAVSAKKFPLNATEADSGIKESAASLRTTGNSSESNGDDLSLRLSELPKSQQSVDQKEEDDVRRKTESGSDGAVIEPREQDGTYNQVERQDNSEEAPEDDQLAKDYISDDPENSALMITGNNEKNVTSIQTKRKKRLTKRERARIMLEGRRAARERRKEIQVEVTKDDLEGPGVSKETKRKDMPSKRTSGGRRRDGYNPSPLNPGGEERSLRSRRSSSMASSVRQARVVRRRQGIKSESFISSKTRGSSRQRRSLKQYETTTPSPVKRITRTDHLTPKTGDKPTARDLRLATRKTQLEEKRRGGGKIKARKYKKTQECQKRDVAGVPGGSLDPYDIDDVDTDQSPEPLKNIHVAKSFGDIRFSKAPSDNDVTSRYARLEKSAEKRRLSTPSSASRLQRAINDTLPVDELSDVDMSPPQLYRIRVHQRTFVDRLSPGGQHILKTVESDRSVYEKETRELTQRQRRQLSPDKSSPSSGNLGDVSSLGTKSSSSGSDPYPRSTPSSGIQNTRSTGHENSVISTRLSGGVNRSRRKSDKSSSSGSASFSLFSDVEPLNGDNGTLVGQEETEKDTMNAGFGGLRKRKRPSTETATEEQIPQIRRTRRRSASLESLPKKPKPIYSVPALDPDKQMEVDWQTQEGCAFVSGSRVLAAWKDKNFYPGHVVENEGLGRYKVMFLDGALRDMPQPDIVPLARLKTGDTLMVDAEAEGELQPATIHKCPEATAEEWYHCMFDVYNQTKEENQRVSWEKLIIDVQQKKHFVSTSVNLAAENVSPGNISGGRARRTRPAAFSMEGSTPRRARQSASSSDSGPRRSKAGRAAPILKPEHNIQQPVTPTAREKEVEEKVQSDYKQIFEGMKFVLTSANRRAKTEFSSDSDEEKPLIQFVKKNVRQMIEERGGTVIDDFSQVVITENLYLVADTHYRTHKYLSALARAIPCVSHIWIHNCCTANEKEDHKNYMLPAGVSLEQEELIDWHDECPRLLKDMTVMVHTENRPQSRTSLDFIQIWAPLVKCMGAQLVEDLPEEGPLDMLLTDASCQAVFLEKAKSLGAFVVSSEWLIQAIITGTRPDPNNHQKYQYDYVESHSSITSSGDSTAN